MRYSVTTLPRFIHLHRMRIFVALAALLQVARCGHVAVRLPYLNPAGVTYVSGYQGHGAPLTYAPGAAPLQYAAASPFQYATPAISAKVEAHHVGYTAAQVPAVAAVPFVKHVPTVSQVPVTRFEHHAGVIEKQVDVLKPAVSTRKVEVRRPAIQKQFYDIEERVIIRPAGSALVELDEPTSKLQKGPAVVQPLAHAATLAHAPLLAHAPVPAFAHAIHSTPAPLLIPSSTPSSAFISSTPAPVNEEEAIVVDNADFRSAQFRDLQSSNSILFRQQQQQHFQQQQLQQRQMQNQQQFQQLQQRQMQDQQLQLQQDQELQQRHLQLQQDQQLQQRHLQLQQDQQLQQRQLQLQQDQQQLQQQQQQQFLKNAHFIQNPTPRVIAKSNGAPLETIARIASQKQGPSLVPSLQTSSEESQANQNRLIDLLTAHGGVTEVGFGHEGQSSSVGDAGQVRARVLSATPAPDDIEPTGEHVSTRRVVVSRPIETLQEFDVVEPATKLERVAFQQPTLIKTAHLDHVQVHGSVPVVGKALAPTVAHAAVPVFQKTISPAYSYYQH